MASLSLDSESRTASSSMDRLVRREGLEPPTRGLEGRRSVHLSYRRADQADQGERYQPGLHAATDDEVPEGPGPPQPPPDAFDEVAIVGRSDPSDRTAPLPSAA